MQFPKCALYLHWAVWPFLFIRRQNTHNSWWVHFLIRLIIALSQHLHNLNQDLTSFDIWAFCLHDKSSNLHVNYQNKWKTPRQRGLKRKIKDTTRMNHFNNFSELSTRRLSLKISTYCHRYWWGENRKTSTKGYCLDVTKTFPELSLKKMYMTISKENEIQWQKDFAIQRNLPLWKIDLSNEENRYPFSFIFINCAWHQRFDWMRKKYILSKNNFIVFLAGTKICDTCNWRRTTLHKSVTRFLIKFNTFKIACFPSVKWKLTPLCSINTSKKHCLQSYSGRYKLKPKLLWHFLFIYKINSQNKWKTWCRLSAGKPRETTIIPTSMSHFSLQNQYIPKQTYDENTGIHQLEDIVLIDQEILTLTL